MFNPIKTRKEDQHTFNDFSGEMVVVTISCHVGDDFW